MSPDLKRKFDRLKNIITELKQEPNQSNIEIERNNFSNNMSNPKQQLLDDELPLLDFRPSDVPKMSHN